MNDELDGNEVTDEVMNAADVLFQATVLKWKKVGENSGQRFNGTSRSSYFLNQKKAREDAAEVERLTKLHRPLTHYFSAVIRYFLLSCFSNSLKVH